MKIRPATLSDLRSVRECARQAYQIYVERMGRRPAPMIADFRRRIEDGILHVLEVSERVQGFVVFFPRDDHVHIENVAVPSEMQGLGYGTRLIGFAEQEARRLGFQSVELYTNEMMTENIGFYRYLGYQEIGRWEEDGFHRVFFRKEL